VGILLQVAQEMGYRGNDLQEAMQLVAQAHPGDPMVRQLIEMVAQQIGGDQQPMQQHGAALPGQMRGRY
jgi:hypothetical protein